MVTPDPDLEPLVAPHTYASCSNVGPATIQWCLLYRWYRIEQLLDPHETLITKLRRAINPTSEDADWG